MLRALIKEMILSEAREFEEWLTPDVMTLLVSNYAMKSPVLGVLSWKYSELSGNLWGLFNPSTRTLHVNRSKTKGLFKQQVETILHEIQHWNQLVIEATNYIDAGGDLSDRLNILGLVRAYNRKYKEFTHIHGYVRNPFEIDARAFASNELDGAMAEIGRHYGGKIEGGELDDVIEELIDDYDPDGPPLTRLQIGTALRDWELNTPANMKMMILQLQDLGVAVK